MNKNQKGLAHVETLLLLIIIAIIGLTGWYVWRSQNNANRSLLNAANTNADYNVDKKDKNSSSGQNYTTSSNLINYTKSKSSKGVAISGESDIDKLDGASDSFKDFIKNDFKKNSAKPSPCGNAYGLFIKMIYKDNFAIGGESHCKNTQKLWAKVSDVWKEIGSTETNFDCSLLEQYKVPSAIIEHCIKNGQLIDNTQS